MNRLNNKILFVIIIISSCSFNSKLNQQNAQKSIEYFLDNNPIPHFVWNHDTYFKIMNMGYDMNTVPENNYIDNIPLKHQSILSIQNSVQFSENEAEIIVHFKEKQCWADVKNLELTFLFKKTIDNKWFWVGVKPLTEKIGCEYSNVNNFDDWLEKSKNINIQID